MQKKLNVSAKNLVQQQSYMKYITKNQLRRSIYTKIVGISLSICIFLFPLAFEMHTPSLWEMRHQHQIHNESDKMLMTTILTIA